MKYWQKYHGELIDKITILEIKLKLMIKKLVNVDKELFSLNETKKNLFLMKI